MDVIQQIQTLLSTAHVPLPPIPKEMSSSIKRVEGGDYFSSRLDAPSPWNIRWYLDELMAEDVQNYLVSGFSGHGVASRGLHYYMVNSDIALFHQSLMASPYGNNADPSSFEHQYELVASIIIAVEDAKAAGKLNKSSRLVIVDSCHGIPLWGIQNQTGRPVEEWHQDGDALIGAANWLASLS